MFTDVSMLHFEDEKPRDTVDHDDRIGHITTIVLTYNDDVHTAHSNIQTHTILLVLQFTLLRTLL
jgi:hypothetical protein